MVTEPSASLAVTTAAFDSYCVVTASCAIAAAVTAAVAILTR